MKNYDVAIVGAGIAGCAAAILFAKKGLTVALVEKKQNHDYYKILCTHTIQSSAIPTMLRVGLGDFIETAGGKYTHHELWTSYGWIKRSERSSNDISTKGYNISRALLDPELKRLALRESNVDYITGDIEDFHLDLDKTCIIDIKTPKKTILKLKSKILVGADGSRSKTAKIGNVNVVSKPNYRFTYYAYFKHESFKNIHESKMWFLNPNIAYAFPNENDIMLLCCGIHKSQLLEFKKNIKNNFINFFKDLDDSPYIEEMEQVTDFIGTLRMENIYRENYPERLALIGDATLTSDPASGVGIAWAFQSAEMLVEHTADSILFEYNVDDALANYYKAHKKYFKPHHDIISKDSLAKPFGDAANFIYSTAVNNSDLADSFFDFCARRIGVNDFFSTLESLK